jgi:hypothetical protein
MRAALVIVALFAVAAAMPLMPETAGNPEKFVIDHDPVEAGYNSSSALWTMFKQCDSVRVARSRLCAWPVFPSARARFEFHSVLATLHSLSLAQC